MAGQLHTRRTALWSVAAALACGRVGAAGTAPMPRIGLLSGAGFPELELAFVDELRKLGLIEDRDFALERRFAHHDTPEVKQMGAQLAQSRVSLVVASSLPLAIAVREANPQMPMIVGTCPGMVSNGFAQSLDKPGGIYTGIDELPPGVTARRLRLLKAAAPEVTRVALLSTTPGHGGHEIQVSDAECAARELGIEVKAYRASSLSGLHASLEAIRADGMNGLQNFQGVLSLINRQLIVDLAQKYRVPAVYPIRVFATDGGLMVYGIDIVDQFQRAASYVDRILRGERAGDLPVQMPTKFRFVINLKTARAIGITVPPMLLAGADEVIE